MQRVDGTRRSPRLLRLILPIALFLAVLLVAVTYLQPSLLPAPLGGTDSAAVRAEGPGGGSAAAPSPADAVRRAWERAQATGSYHVAVGIKQTAIPQPLPANIGQHEQSLTLSAEGDVRLPDFARLSMRVEDAGSSAQPVTVVQEGSQTFVEKDGKREPAQSPAGFASPTMDFMAFLAGVENVQPAESTASGQEPLTSYTFDVSGPRFARYLSDRVRAQLTEELGQAPEVQTSPTLSRMTGRGQLWVDSNGLPRREVLDLTMPEVSDQYDGKAHLEVMFSQFGPLPAASAAGGGSTVAGQIGSAVSSAAATAGAAAPSGIALALVLALVVCLIVSYRRRLVYKIFAILTVVIMVSSPVLQDLKLARVLGGYAEAAAAPSALVASGLVGASGATAQGQAALDASSFAAVRDAASLQLSRSAPAAPLAAPTLPKQQQSGPDYSPDRIAACGDGDSSVDSDADGLSDLVESCLGTDPTEPDTDGDAIPDGLEAYGIVVTGKDGIARVLTSNPFEGSSSGDGISDAQKWPVTLVKLDDNGRPIVGTDGHLVVTANESDKAATYGLASSWDLDDDKIPNVWDDDIDGDAVPNELDLSPSDRTAFASQLDLSTQGGGYTGYENIDVQVRPENPDHMKAPDMVFDWPLDDDKGQIQHLRQTNNYTDSMRLVLMLQIDANVAPPEALARDQGIVVQQQSSPQDPTKPYRLLVPMSPNTIDGKPYAFSARVSYGGDGTVPDVQWTAKLIWLLVAKTDSYYNCTNPASPSATSCKVKTETMLANVYDETFQLTGLNLTKSGTEEVAVFGTPNSTVEPNATKYPNIEHEDGMLYKLYVGLETFFQGYDHLADQAGTMLQTIETRLNSPAIDQSLQWGMDNTVKVSRKEYANGDRAMVGSADQVSQFLEANYENNNGPHAFCQDGKGQSFLCTSLIVATESHEGFAGLGSFQSQSVGSTLKLSASLANIPVATYRSVHLNMYEHKAAGWAAMDPARMMSVLTERYEDALPTILARVQQAQPNLTADYLRFGLFFAYARASGGGTSTIKIDEQMLKPLAAASEGQLLTELGLWAPGNTTPLPENYVPKNVIDFSNWELQGFFSDIKPAPATAYVGTSEMAVIHPGVIGDALGGTTSGGGFGNWMGGKLTAAAKWAKANPGQAGNLALKAALIAANTILSTISYFCVDENGNSTCKGVDPQAMQVAGKVISGVSIARQIYETGMSIKEAVSASAKAAESAVKGAQAAAEGISKVAVVGAVVGVVLNVGMTAYATWAAVKNLDTHSPIFGIIIAQAVISVLLNVLFTVLSFIPIVNIISSIFQIIDAILGWILGFFNINFSMTSWIILGLCALFYQPLLLTKLESQGFTGMSAGPPPNQTGTGLVEGTHYQITDHYSATLRTTDELVLGPPANTTAESGLYHGSTSDLDKSWASATYTATSTDDATAALLNSARNCTNISDDVRTCTNAVGVDFTLVHAKKNVDLTFQVTTYATTVYAVCGLNGLVCGNALAKDNVTSSMSVWPDPNNPTDSDPQPITLTVDVLPATIDALFVWPEVGRTNNGTTNDPYVSDADADGLVDAAEARVGTSSDPANGADSDQDGATDGQEVCRWSTTANGGNGGLVGGWDVTLPGPITMHVCSNPRDGDFDDDGQTDGAEMSAGTSPYAVNNGPRISLAPSPLTSHLFQPPYPTTGVFVPSDTEVTLDLGLLNVTSGPINGTLSLCLPSSIFTGTTSGGSMTGARNPVRVGPTTATWCESGTGKVITWDFSPAADNLMVGEVVTTTVKSTATASQSTSGTISLRLADSTGKEIATTMYPIRVDVDNPSVGFTFPTAGAILGGGQTSYVLGGTASDPTTWAKKVVVTLPTSKTTTTTTTITKDSEISPWAVSWTLPEDYTYTLTAEATDYVGHTASTSVQVTVDNTPPEGTITLPGSGFVAPTSGTTVVTIAGTVADNLSGVARAEVSIDGQPWRHTAFDNEGKYPTASSGWSFPWTIDPSAAGSHRIALRAFDRAGNASNVVTGTLTVDTDAPTHNLTTAPGQVEQNQPFTVYGRSNDAGRVALPPRPEALQGGIDKPISANSKATVWLEPDGIADYDGGISATWIGDVDGDGRADLAIGLPASAEGKGRVSVLHGRAGGWPVKPDTEAISSSPTSFVGATGARIGDVIATAGDVNADGRYDLLIGDTANGRAFLIFGQPGLYGRDVVLDRPQSGARVLIKALNLSLLAPAGDVNGDGYADFLVGVGGSVNKVYLILGDSAGTLPNPLDPTVEAAAVAPLCSGCAATGVGDANGDGKADFVVTGDKAVYLFRGDTGFARRGLWDLTLGSGTHGAAATFSSQDASPRVTALGDVNGDGHADFIYSNGSNPSLVLGRTSGSWAGQAFSFDPAASGFLAAPGDVNGDGKADMLLGRADNKAYLVLGAATFGTVPPVQALISDVAGASSAPYAAGADCNCDSSSDLLLAPPGIGATLKLTMPRTELDLGPVPHIAAESLPVAESTAPTKGPETQSAGAATQSISATGQPPAGLRASAAASDSLQGAPVALAATTRTVDDDCADSSCYKTIQDAIDAASSGDTIFVKPGMYSTFDVSGKDNLTIQGADPDAVVLTGPGLDNVVHITNAVGVRVTGMSLRGAANAIRLDGAGVGGASDPTKVIELDHLVLYMVTHALSMDRTSTANFHDITSNGDESIQSQISVDSTPDPAFAPVWAGPTTAAQKINAGSSVISRDGDSYYYTLPSAAATTILKNDSSFVDAPSTTPQGARVLAGVDAHGLYMLRGNRIGGMSPSTQSSGMNAVAAAGSSVYVGGEYQTTAKNLDGSSQTINNIGRWDLVEQKWYPLGQGVPEPIGMASAVQAIATVPGTSNVYVGGAFASVLQTSGSAVTVNHIGKWDGLNWSSLGGGVNGTVYSILVDGTDVYVGGGFSQAGSVSANNIAKWNGSSWSALGTGIGVGGSNPVYAMAKVGNDLCAGGGFVSGVWCWNGTSWYTLGPGLNGAVRSLVYTGVSHSWEGVPVDLGLIAGGDFTMAGSTQVNHIARWDNGAWHALGTGTDGIVRALAYSGTPDIGQARPLLYVGGDFLNAGGVYAPRLAAWKLDTSATWQSVGGVDNSVNGLDVLGDDTTYGDLYVAGKFGKAGGDPDTSWTHEFVARFARSFAYDFDYGHWSPWPFDSTALSWELGAGATAATDSSGNIYVLAGGGTQKFYKGKGASVYGVSQGRPSTPWAAKSDLPAAAGVGASLAWVPGGTSGTIYAIRGGGTGSLYKYDPATDTWTTLASLPSGNVFGAGASIAYQDGYIYALPGGGSQAIFRYDMAANTWAQGPNTPDSAYVATGGFLVGIGHYLHAARGGDSQSMYTFGMLSSSAVPQKLTVKDVAFYASRPQPDTKLSWLSPITSGTWIGAPSDDFAMNVLASTGNQWVGGSSAAVWTPTTPLNPANAWITTTAAKFIDPNSDHPVYRVLDGSTLTAGYYTFHADVHVSPSYGSGKPNDGYVWGNTAFSSIQEAISSGAQRVYLAPGIYPQSFYLVNGVQVLGSGADATIVKTGGGTLNGALVLAEGISSAGVSRLTLVGSSTVIGLRAEQSARLRFSRSIIRGASTGILMQTSGSTHVEIVNDDFVGNTRGIVSENCANVDVRNSVLAFNSEVGLKYTECPYQSPLHTYNDYFANGTPGNNATGDIVVDNNPARAADGPGEIGVDPTFTNPAQNDYRPQPGSPLIDAGTPTDPAPPGSGGRVDIGYVESSQASFYADKTFCATCDNFGLTWQVDAFDTIQGAVNAAQRAAAAIGSPTVFTVGVGAGTYAEKVTIPSYIRLVGSGAEATTVNGGGTGSVLTIDGATQVEVRGFKITGSGTGANDAGILITGAANGVTVTRNIVTGNKIGIDIAGGASDVLVDFNTVVSNTAPGVRANGTAAWANVRNSIFSSNEIGIQAINGGKAFADYNLMSNPANYSGGTAVAKGTNNKETTDPKFDPAYSGQYRLLRDSPAVDSADPTADSVSGGGKRADIGYRELLAAPLSLLFGRQGISCAFGNSGVAKVEVGLVGPLSAEDAKKAVKDTAPTTWSTAPLQGSTGDTARYWNATFTPTSGGTYRLYARSTDSAGNLEPEKDWFVSNVEVVGTPTVAWVDPTGDTSTNQAAIPVTAQVTDYVNPTTGQRFPVKTATFEVGGSVYATEWLDGPNTQPRRFRAVLPLSVVNGSQQITAIAVDSAGVDGQASLKVTTTTPSDVATIAAPLPGGAINSQTFTVYGYARFTTTAGTASVTVQVSNSGGNIGSPVSATLASPTEQFSAWTASITLPSTEGAYSLAATASRSGGAPQAAVAGGYHLASPDARPIASALADSPPITLTYDRTVPTISQVTPAAGSVIASATFVVEVTATDSGSGIAAVEVSQDGGTTWHYAGLDSGTGHYKVTLSAINPADYVSQRLTVRATDNASNQTTTSQTVIFDNIPPQPLVPAFSVPLGTHFNAPTSIVVTWPAPVDASGTATVVAVVDNTAGTIPGLSASTVTSPYSASLTGSGDWYVHLQARDNAGNNVSQSYGPWHVDNRDSTGVACADRSVSIAVDGSIDAASGVAAEWRADRELLDYDVRSGRVQALYATWDANALYLGWRGAQWATDGTLWAYVQSSASSGSWDPVPGQNITPTLPFPADYAIQIDGQGDGTLWKYTGGKWVEQAGTAWSFAHLGQDTEIKLPWTLTDVANLRLLAFAADDDGKAWSVFPTTNALDGTWAGKDSYGASTGGSWSNPCSVTVPNAGQPQGRYVSMSITNSQDHGQAWAPDSTLAYTLKVKNPYPQALSYPQLRIESSSGLKFNDLTCDSAGSGWVCSASIVSIAASGETSIPLTAKLASSLSGQSTVTAKLSLLNVDQSAPIGQATITHRVDGTPPTVSLDTTALKAGTQTVVGTADDGVGSGVAKVEIEAPLAGIPSFQAVSGTANWSASLTVPSSLAWVPITVKATDGNGLVTSLSKTLPVDTTPPTATLSVPAISAGGHVAVSGTASDGMTRASGVKLVEVQVDADTAPWKPAIGPFPCATGDCWTFGWDAPGENGKSHQVRARATDAVGNVGEATEWQSTTVYATATDLAITMVGQFSTSPKPTVTYTITVTNKGPNAIWGATVTDTFPTTLTSASWKCTSATAGSACLAGVEATGNLSRDVVLPVGGSAIFTVTAQLADGVTGPIGNTAQVTLPTGVPDIDSSTNQVTVSTQLSTPPAVAPPDAQSASEGETKSFALGSFTDTGADGPWSVDVDWGDTSLHSPLSVTAAGPVGELTHTYADNGTYTIVVTITDQSKASGSASFTATVVNVAPTAKFTATSPIDEGGASTLSFSSQVDPSTADAAAGFHYAYSCTNGDLSWATYANTAESTSSTTCTFDKGQSTHVVSARIIDKDGGSNDYGTEVTVNNVAPTVNAGSDATIDEGGTFTSSGSFADPGADTWTGTVDYGDGSGVQTLALNADKTFSLSHTYADNGLYTVTVTVKDSGEASGSDTAKVAVNNIAPTAAFAATSPIDEGNSSSLSFTGASDPSTADAAAGFHYSFACDGLDTSLATTYAKAGAEGTATCPFPDSGDHTVKGRILDKNDGYSTYSATVTVSNVAPIAALGNSGPVDEGSSATIKFSGQSDPSSGDTTAGFHYAFSCTDGDLSRATYASSGTSDSTACTFDDNGSYTVKGRIIDREDGYSEYTTTVTVNNANPTATLNTPASVSEGSAINLSLTNPSDPSSKDLAAGFQYAFDCGSGYGAFSSSNTASCQTSDNGSRTVKGQIRDKDGGTAEYEATVQVNNVAPVVNAGLDATIKEGAVFTSSGSFADPGSDTWTATVDYGDGSVVQTLTLKSDKTFDLSHVYVDNGVYTVTVVVTDKDNANGSDTAIVTVNNVTPVVTAPPNQSANEGTLTSFALGSFADPGADNPWAVDVNWGDGSTHTTLSMMAQGTITAQSHTYADGPNTYTVTVKVTDKDLASDSKTFAVTVNNVAPIVTAPSNQIADEGTLYSFALGSFSDLGLRDGPWSVGLDWGDSTHTAFDASAIGKLDNQDHQYADNGNYTVTVKVTDKDGGFDSKTFTVEVSNVAPTVTAPRDQTADEGAQKLFDLGSFSDLGLADGPWSVDVNWGDGSTHTTLSMMAQGTITAQSHTYADGPNTYTVTVKVTDKDLASDSKTFAVTVANIAPTVAFVAPTTTSIAEGATVTYNFTVSDPGQDTFTVKSGFPDCGTGGSYITGSLSATASGGSFQCNFPDGPATATVQIQVADSDSADSNVESASVTVSNVVPTVSASPASQSVQYSDSIQTISITATDVPADTLTIATQWQKDGGAFQVGLPDAGTLTGGLVLSGPAEAVGSGTWTVSGIADLAPGTYTLRFTLSDEDGGSTSKDVTITVTKEDARATYTGALFASTPSATSMSATVTLRATIQDISAVAGDSAYDASAGDITHATVTFVNRDNGAVIASNVPVGLLTPGDTKTGTAIYDWTVTISCASSPCSQTYTIGVIVGGYYTRDSSDDDAIVNVAQPGTNFITGGGYLVMQSSAGLYPGAAGTKNNFGFNVKYNKSGTNLQGNLNTIVRNGGRVYQIKGNSMTSLGVAQLVNSRWQAGCTGATAASPCRATFNGKASIQDITNPTSPISIDGGATLQVTMTDYGSAGGNTISITVWNKKGGLWFASNWSGKQTIEQKLGGGNLIIR